MPNAHSTGYKDIVRVAEKGFRVGKRILIVDDSALIRRMIRERLEQQGGWEVSGEAANGREAIEKAEQLKPDLIVLDLSMPVMNGLEAARELQRLLPSLPLVMFTNFNSPQLTNEALSAGVSAVVSKSELAGLGWRDSSIARTRFLNASFHLFPYDIQSSERSGYSLAFFRYTSMVHLHFLKSLVDCALRGSERRGNSLSSVSRMAVLYRSRTRYTPNQSL